jgi:hypothetical protein
LLELFILLIFPILVDVLLVEVILVGRNEWCLDLLLPKILPWEILQPRMSLDLCRAVLTKSIRRLSLDHLPHVLHVHGLTLLMKSAASTDQPLGISFFLICICFDNM